MRPPSLPVPVLYIPFLTPLGPVDTLVKQPVLVDHSQPPCYPVIIYLLGQHPVMVAKNDRGVIYECIYDRERIFFCDLNIAGCDLGVRVFIIGMVMF